MVGAQNICAMDRRFATTESQISAPEYAHGFFPGWFLMFNLRRILHGHQTPLGATEEVRVFTINRAAEGYSIGDAHSRGWKFTGTEVCNGILNPYDSAEAMMSHLARVMTVHAQSYQPQRNVTLTTPDNERYKAFLEQVTPEAAIMLNLYTPGTLTARQHAERDNRLFTEICRTNAEEIIARLSERFGSNKAVERYVQRLGAEAEFVFQMQDYGHLRTQG